MTRRWIWLVRSKIWVILASHLDGAAINGSVTVLTFRLQYCQACRKRGSGVFGDTTLLLRCSGRQGTQNQARQFGEGFGVAEAGAAANVAALDCGQRRADHLC
jgi:hypothetical protein